MEDWDWTKIFGQGVGDPSQLPLAVNELAPPPINTGGAGTGPGTMGRGALSPPTPPTPANTPQVPLQPPAPVTPTEGTMPLSPPGTGLRGRQGEEMPDVGAALNGVPVPRPRPTDLSSQNAGGGGAAGPITLGGPGGPTPFGGAAGTPADQAKKMQGIAAALKGVAAPAAPMAQKVATPNAPRPTGTIKGGDLQALLMALNAGGVGAPGARPATLGQTIGR